MTVEDTIERVAREMWYLTYGFLRDSYDDAEDREKEDSREEARAALSSLRPGDALGNGLRAEQDWQPIETAPTNSTKVDLWMWDQSGRVWREADAYYVTNRVWEWTKYEDDGSYRTVRDCRDGWYAPNHDYEGADGWCDYPRTYNPHPNQRCWVFVEPTHWRPLPVPPHPQQESEAE